MGEVIIPDKIFPEWKVNSAFINVHLSRGLGLDGKLSSHPVEVEVKDANEVNQVRCLSVATQSNLILVLRFSTLYHILKAVLFSVCLQTMSPKRSSSQVSPFT
jgi:aminopeptidase 2